MKQDWAAGPAISEEQKMSETRERSSVSALLAILFGLLVFIAAVAFGAGILGGDSQEEATATPSQTPTDGPSATPGPSQTPEPTASATTLPVTPSQDASADGIAVKAQGSSRLALVTQTVQPVGEIQGTIVSLAPGSISYAVVGLPGGGTTLMPWQAFDRGPRGETVLLTSLDPQVIEGAPTYEPAQYPDLIGDPDWDAEFHTFWSGHMVLPESLALEGQEERIIAAALDRLAGMQVTAAEGTPVGQFVDVILDLETAMPVYAVITVSGDAIETGGTILVPWERLAEVRRDPPSIILAASVEALAGSPRVEIQQLPDLIADPEWDRAIREYWTSLI